MHHEQRNDRLVTQRIGAEIQLHKFVQIGKVRGLEALVGLYATPNVAAVQGKALQVRLAARQRLEKRVAGRCSDIAKAEFQPPEWRYQIQEWLIALDKPLERVARNLKVLQTRLLFEQLSEKSVLALGDLSLSFR